MKQPKITLSNGVEIPQIGFGTWQLRDGPEAEQAVARALEVGYRHIDTASIYGNEASVGSAVSNSDIGRGEIFVTTKVWNTDHGYDSTLEAFAASKERLGLDYVDLYLIHWAKRSTYVDTWRAMEELYERGEIKAIGVSNFYQKDLERLMGEASVMPMVNQVELHPWLSIPDVREFCLQHNIAVEAWSPIAQAQRLDDPTIKKIAKKHGKTPAQVILRWDIQLGLISIPRSSNNERIKENFEIFDFELDENDMKQIDALNENARLGPHPEKFNF